MKDSKRPVVEISADKRAWRYRGQVDWVQVKNKDIEAPDLHVNARFVYVDLKAV